MAEKPLDEVRRRNDHTNKIVFKGNEIWLTTISLRDEDISTIKRDRACWWLLEPNRLAWFWFFAAIKSNPIHFLAVVLLLNSADLPIPRQDLCPTIRESDQGEEDGIKMSQSIVDTKCYQQATTSLDPPLVQSNLLRTFRGAFRPKESPVQRLNLMSNLIWL